LFIDLVLVICLNTINNGGVTMSIPAIAPEEARLDSNPQGSRPVKYPFTWPDPIVALYPGGTQGGQEYVLVNLVLPNGNIRCLGSFSSTTRVDELYRQARRMFGRVWDPQAQTERG
jgi:hypothetical protein